VSPFNTHLVQQLSAPNTFLVISDLSRLECRIKPIRDGNQLLLGGYAQFFREAISQIASLSTEVIDLATEIRANFGFTTPDAIHLAAAMVTKCDEFLTNDQRLQRFDEMRVVVIAKQN
jgi:predicted nucleic acid-binding protein